jgi:hypothetical protein
MKYIVFLLMITITGYSQTIDRNNVIARQKLQFSGGNPDSNKIAVSVDANGIFKWVYFTDFQDSLNTGIYDTTTANVVVTQAIRITGATFASDTLVSIGTSGTVSKCFATCDTIQYILDNLGGGGYSPWDSLSGNVFLKDSTDKVGIGTNSPIAKLDVDGSIYFSDTVGNYAYVVFSFVDSSGTTFNINGFNILTGNGGNLNTQSDKTAINYVSGGNEVAFISAESDSTVRINTATEQGDIIIGNNVIY